MADKRDYYEVLGIQKGATEDEIKKAYRSKAIKYHPDKFANASEAEKKDAEEKFKEINEAYQVLSDSQKRAQYDQFGHAAFDGTGGAQGGPFGGFGGFEDLGDILRGFGFGGFGGSAQRGPTKKVYRGEDLEVSIKLSLEEILNGCKKEISYWRKIACHECGGKGAKSDADIKTCPACQGSGQVKRVVNGFFGQSVQYSVCQQCGGEGKIIGTPCRNCSGSGLERKKETVTVNIPAGVQKGMKKVMTGYGNAGKNNGTTGDLIIWIDEAENDNFTRNGRDIECTKVISVLDAMLGGEVEVKGLDGTYKVKIEAGTQSGVVKRLKGVGLPSLNSSNRGDLYVRILVHIPHKFSRKEKEALESMRSSESFNATPSKDERSFFEKIKDIFD